MQVKNSAVFESMPAAVQIFAAVDGEGDAPLTVSDARAFIASRTHASVKAAQPSAEPNPELAAELKNCWFRYEKTHRIFCADLASHLIRAKFSRSSAATARAKVQLPVCCREG